MRRVRAAREVQRAACGGGRGAVRVVQVSGRARWSVVGRWAVVRVRSVVFVCFIPLCFFFMVCCF